MAITTIPGTNYKKSLHLYVLDKDYYTERTATVLEDVLRSDNATNIDAVVRAYLIRASVTLYDYIYSFNPKFKKYIQYLLCHNQDYAECIRECLIDMVNYWALNGLDATILNPVLNVDVQRTAPVLSHENLVEASIPLSVRNKIHNEKLDTKWKNMKYDEGIFEIYAKEEELLKEV